MVTEVHFGLCLSLTKRLKHFSILELTNLDLHKIKMPRMLEVEFNEGFYIKPRIFLDNPEDPLHEIVIEKQPSVRGIF